MEPTQDDAQVEHAKETQQMATGKLDVGIGPPAAGESVLCDLDDLIDRITAHPEPQREKNQTPYKTKAVAYLGIARDFCVKAGIA